MRVEALGGQNGCEIKKGTEPTGYRIYAYTEYERMSYASLKVERHDTEN